MINLGQNQRVIRVKVRPNAAATRVAGMMADGTIKIDVAAPPDKNKANRELARFLSKELKVPAENVKIVSGAGKPFKIVKIEKIYDAQIQKRHPAKKR